jgi:hypothetical protein
MIEKFQMKAGISEVNSGYDIKIEVLRMIIP